MKRLFVIALMAGSLGLLAGCSKDAEFDEFIKENDSLAEEMKKKEGPEDAKKVFDEKKDSLKKKFDAIKDARGFQVKEETKKKFEESITKNAMSICTSSPTSCEEYTNMFKTD